MRDLIVLFQKEWRENTRNFKILWIPLVFIFFGLSEPLTSYYLPQILEAVGNLPEGAAFPLPDFTPAQVIMATMGQYQFIGMLVLVLGFAGTISRERKNGTGTLLYVRPISYLSYFLSKWKVIGTIALLSVWLGLLTTWYYTELLFGNVVAADFFRICWHLQCVDFIRRNHRSSYERLVANGRSSCSIAFASLGCANY